VRPERSPSDGVWKPEISSRRQYCNTSKRILPYRYFLFITQHLLLVHPFILPLHQDIAARRHTLVYERPFMTPYVSLPYKYQGGIMYGLTPPLSAKDVSLSILFSGYFGITPNFFEQNRPRGDIITKSLTGRRGVQPTPCT
jgi:hypothetical protein